MQKSKIGVVGSFIGIVVLTVLLSLLMSNLFRGNVEEKELKPLSISESMTVLEIAEVNHVKISSLKEALQIKDDQKLSQTLGQLGLTEDIAKDKIAKKMNLEAEEASKNFVLIFAKFIFWILLMLIAFALIRKGKISNKARNYLLIGSFTLFGAIFGSDPNSMSTITDMVSAYAIKGIFFPPRLIALVVFLLFGFLANKFFCGWACQFGALQDFIFRLNRDSNNKKGIFKQYKVPFAISNTIRLIFFSAFLLIAFLWSANIIETINPFNIFNPGKFTIIGISFISLLLIASLFIYRPWCHFFCPFGLASWIVEKFSRFRIRVNYNTCVACEECTKACPSHAMGAILKQDKVIPDCFACGICMNACPTKSIVFSNHKIEEIPEKTFQNEGIKNKILKNL